jgi:hypothetical protein
MSSASNTAKTLIDSSVLSGDNAGVEWVCAAYNFVCSADNGACTPEQVGQTFEAYIPTSKETCDTMKLAPAMYPNTVCCETDGCNDPDKKLLTSSAVGRIGLGFALTIAAGVFCIL